MIYQLTTQLVLLPIYSKNWQSHMNCKRMISLGPFISFLATIFLIVSLCADQKFVPPTGEDRALCPGSAEWERGGFGKECGKHKPAWGLLMQASVWRGSSEEFI